MSEWISVVDQLPAVNIPVLTAGDDGLHVGTRKVKSFGWIKVSYWSYAVSDFDLDGVTHWQPLPYPPVKPEPKLTVKEALREAIDVLDSAFQSSRGCRNIPIEKWYDWSMKSASLLPRLRAALEGEE